MLELGIIGGGLVFQGAHAGVLSARNDVRVAAVADPDPAFRGKVGESFPAAKLLEDYRDLLALDSVGAVDICLPHHLHERVVLDAFAAGKHVILEKPIALTVAEADRMIAAAEAHGRQFHVALNQRFYSPHRKVKELIDAGGYGAPFFAVAHIFGNELERMNIPDNWKGTWERSGGGALADSGTHAIDLMLWWFGRPERVSCQWGRFITEAENKADDNVVVTLGYAHMIAEVAVSYSVVSDPWRETKWVYLRDASLHVDAHPGTPLVAVKGGHAPEAVECDAPEEWWPASVGAGLSHWLDCLLGQAQPDFGPEAARETLEIINLAYQAAKEGRTLLVPSRS